MICKLVKKIQQINFIHFLKIYKNNLKNGGYAKNLDLSLKLPRSTFFRDSVFFSKVIEKDILDILDVALYQKLLAKNFNNTRFYAMLSIEKSKRSHIINLPKVWRKFFANNNIKVNFFSFVFFAKEILRTFIQTFKTIIYLLALYKKDFNKGSTVCNVVNEACDYESISKGKDLENYFYWIKKRYNSEFYYIFPCQNQAIENVFFVKYPFPSISGIGKKLSFAISALFYTSLSFISIIFGKWQIFYLLEDIIFYQYASRAEKGALPKNVIFTIQNCIYKPLWAYALEKSNVSIEVVFFGVNDSFYLLKDGTYVGPSNEYTDMTWKRYHVVNNMQRDRLEKTLSLNPLFRKNNVSITVENNAIPLYDSRVDLSFLDKTRNIVFFPVTPFFEPLVARIGYTDRLHTYEITESILSELISWAAKNNYTVVLKDKNYNDDKVNRKYKKLVESLVKRNSINYISFSNMSPKRLIEKCDAVICQPFTSPAIFAQSQKKPVCYADPSSLLLKDQQASSGIEIVQGQGSLSQWLSNQLISND